LRGGKKYQGGGSSSQKKRLSARKGAVLRPGKGNRATRMHKGGIAASRGIHQGKRGGAWRNSLLRDEGNGGIKKTSYKEKDLVRTRKRVFGSKRGFHEKTKKKKRVVQFLKNRFTPKKKEKSLLPGGSAYKGKTSPTCGD